jgi:2-octaprenyl-3-methyl-6-methoxy-1,4-benzoquinol hydroxylase
MSRRGRLDALVVGGGVVGCAAALALAQRGLDVALIEAQAPAPGSPERRDLRVYAFAADNVMLLDSLGVWPSIRDARVQPYRRMHVCYAAGGDALVFDAETMGELVSLVEQRLNDLRAGR